MFKINKFALISLIFLVILITLFNFARKEAHLPHRDPEVLMNRYYLLKDSTPDAARNSLVIILHQDTSYVPALKELSQIYLKENDIKQAIPLILKLHQLFPKDPQYSTQLAHIYYDNGNWEKAYTLLTPLEKSSTVDIREKVKEMLQLMSSSIPGYQLNALTYSKTATVNNAPYSIVAQTLLSRFYQIQNTDAKQATQILHLLALISNNDPKISLELGYLELQHKNNAQAIPYFLEAYNQHPSAVIALQLAYLYSEQNDNKQAAQFFLLAMRSDDAQIKQTATHGYDIVNNSNIRLVAGSAQTKQSSASRESLLLDQFYALKKQNKQAAWSLLQQIIKRYPNNLLALKEGGFLAIELKHRVDAITYFTKAYELSYQPEIAMQLGYLYDQPDTQDVHANNHYLAYHYFNLATKSTDKQLELRAQNALTNLSGLQTKVLPSPFFSELFFDPFSQSRFGLTVRPFIGRVGIESSSHWQTKLYLALRQTEDNKSFNRGQIPQIYEDNARITSLGVQITPCDPIPLVAFFEAGRAYDLVYRNRDRWRNDVRSGVMYYNEFGNQPAYFDTFKLSTRYYSTVYGDATYFSRYNNNIIATVKTHQGIRLAQYHSTMLNLYLSGRIIEDTRREFFNNIAEIGPGIGFIPSNRYKVEIRFEHINGAYLPSGTFNPYGKYYINNTVQLFLYTKL